MPVVVVAVVGVDAVVVVAATAAAAAMCGLLFTSQLARCRCRSSSILLRCIPIPDSLKVSFIIAINQTEKKRMRHCNERRVAAVETNNPTLCVSRCRFSAAK